VDVRWILDNDVGPRYAFWTRANISEVFPEPPSPLSWDLVWEGAALAGWRDLFVQRFGMDDGELDRYRFEGLGIFGGYAYLGAALFRVWAARMPGLSPTAIDDFYFGGHPDVPPYVPEEWHTNARTTEVMSHWVQWATVDLDQRELQRDHVESLQIRRARPDFARLSDEALLGHAVGMRPLFRRLLHQHINQSGAASFGPGIISSVCAAMGKEEWALRLLAALGDVESAAPSFGMWELSRGVRRSKRLTSIFDSGMEGLYEQMRGSDDDAVVAFLAAFDGFLAEFGARGTNEWDLIAPVWEIAPDAALAAIDRLRLADDTSSPRLKHAALRTERRDLEAQVQAALANNAEALGAFEVGLRSAGTFIPGRERSKTTIIRVLHEARLATAELGRRAAARGTLEHPADVYMLFVDELTELVAGNLPYAGNLVAPRTEHRAWLASLEPPFIINGQPPPNSTWPLRVSHLTKPVIAGDVISGTPGSPGHAQGQARVITDPAQPGALGPGDILVASVTDPSWTPLFVVAGAVIVDVGALLSHAVIVSRELGIPCVVSTVDASKRIPDNALLSVDGDNGLVTVLDVPA
jgi:phosphohistidine swiveling domain-containing protein